jgi:hypothetical protein
MNLKPPFYMFRFQKNVPKLIPTIPFDWFSVADSKSVSVLRL